MIRKPFYLGETEVTNAQFRRFAEATGYQTDSERGVPLDGHTKGSFAHVPSGADRPREWSDAASWRTPFPYLGNPPAAGRPPGRPRELDTTRSRSPTTSGCGCRPRRSGSTPPGPGPRPCTRGGTTRPAGPGTPTSRPRRTSSDSRRPTSGSRSTTGPQCCPRPGRTRPNAWGLKDMIGNVEEWVQDTYAKYPPDGADQSAATGDGGRVIRGRSWLDGPGMNRPAMQPFARRDFIGFRVATSVDQ